MVDACSETCTGNSRNQFIEEKIPNWLIQALPHRRLALRQAPVAVADWYRTASKASHAALAQAVKTAWLSQSRLDKVFEPLADARRFAEPLLQKALKDRFGVELDVSRTFLRLYLPTGILNGYKVKTLSLLDAALHNFEVKESAANYFDSASCFISEPDARGHFSILSLNKQIGIDAFILACRDLDIGGQYSQQLEAMLLPTDAVAKAVLEYRVKTSQKDAFRAAVLLARMKGDICADSQVLLLRLLDGVRSPGMHCYQLQIMTARLTGIMLLAGDLERSSWVEPLLVYIPDDPLHPIKEYPSTLAFRATLIEQLRSPVYQRFFARFIDHAQRGAFFAALDQQLNVVKWHPPQPADPRPAWRNTPIDKPVLRFHMHKVQSDPWQWLYQGALNKILNDARNIAVPTADEDRQSRWEFWDSLQNVASIFLQVATLVAVPFVPFAGELMLAYTAYQLLDDTFTGILDWAEGQVAEAADHLLGIAENLAQLAAFGTAATVVGRVLAIKPSAFVEGLKPVTLHDGRTRLWNPDLAPYEQSVSLPMGGATDELGLEHHAGKTFLTLESRTYEVAADPDSGAYHVRHPERPTAYRPRLTHNGEGAWAHEVERPMEWQGAQLFRRLGHSVAEFSDITARRILAVSGIDEAVLRDLHVHSRRPPALLEDSIRRFRLDDRISTLRAQLLSADPAVYARVEPQMQAQLLQMHGVRIFESQLRNGKGLQAIVESLDDATLKKLLGVNPTSGDSLPAIEVRCALLRARMADWAKVHRSELFNARELAFEHSTEEEIRQLRRVFPELPKTICKELWRNAGASEHLRIHNRLGISRPMAYEALSYLRELRLSRACEGLYLEAVSHPDSDRIALHMFEKISGWSPHVRLEVRGEQFTGTLLDSVGSPEAPVLGVLVRQNGKYQAHDAFGVQLHGFDTLYGAVMHALPDGQRSALGLSYSSRGSELKQLIQQQPLPSRATLRKLFAQPPVGPDARSPMGLAVGRSGYLLGGGDFKSVESRPIEQRLRALYPTLSEEDLADLRSERMTGDPLQAVTRLEIEYLTLVNELEIWVKAVPERHPLTGLPLDAGTVEDQVRKRQAFMEELKASWSRKQTSASPYEPYHFYLYLDIIGELPELSADFSHVTELVLGSHHQPLQGHGFLKGFTGLQFLTLEGINLETFPMEIFQMRRLESLTLNRCALRLSEPAAEGLSRIESLKLLSLNDNPLGISPHLGFMKGLRDVYLHDAGLSEVPSGLSGLEYLSRVDLTSNDIIEVPDEFFDIPDTRTIDVDLSDNPLGLETIAGINEYLDRASLDRKILIRFDELPSEEDSFSSDFEDGSADSAISSGEESDGGQG